MFPPHNIKKLLPQLTKINTYISLQAILGHTPYVYVSTLMDNDTTDLINLILHHTIDDQEITIRPIYPTDKAIEADFVRNLSAHKRRYRFMGALKELSSQLLTKLCTVDGHSTMAFIATIQDNDNKEVEIGVCRYVHGGEPDTREFAITTADDWHEKDLDVLLFNQLIKYARYRGVKHLYSVDLADDPFLRDLAQKLDMKTTRDPKDVHQVIHSLDL